MQLQDNNPVSQSGVFDMAGFGSPAVAEQEEGLIAAVPSSAPFRTFLQAVASQAQAGQGADVVIHSPWAPTLLLSNDLDNPFLHPDQSSAPNHPVEFNGDASLRSAASLESAFSFGAQLHATDSLVSNEHMLRQGGHRMMMQESGCSLRQSGGPFPHSAGVPWRSGGSLSSTDMGLTNVGSLKPSAPHFPIGDTCGNASDSDMDDSVDQLGSTLSGSEDDGDDCMKQPGSSLQFEMLAADLDDRFEALSMLSPDNQVPLLSRSLGRRVSVHGAHADMLEPWGRAAVFGCNTTSSGKLSIAASLAGVSASS